MLSLNDTHLDEFSKENFNLKRKIYYLEDALNNTLSGRYIFILFIEKLEGTTIKH